MGKQLCREAAWLKRHRLTDRNVSLVRRVLLGKSLPSELRDISLLWDAKKEGAAKPKVLAMLAEYVSKVEEKDREWERVCGGVGEVCRETVSLLGREVTMLLLLEAGLSPDRLKRSRGIYMVGRRREYPCVTLDTNEHAERVLALHPKVKSSIPSLREKALKTLGRKAAIALRMDSEWLGDREKEEINRRGGYVIEKRGETETAKER